MNRIVPIQKVLFLRLASDAFQGSPHLRNIRPPFDLAYSMALLKGNQYKFHFIDGWVARTSIDELVERTRECAPDMIVVSSTTDATNVCVQFAGRVKNNGMMIVAIGQHASAEPDDFVCEDSPIDFCILGEPEEALANLIRRFNNAEPLTDLTGVVGRTMDDRHLNIVEDIEALPMPDSRMFTQRQGYHSFYPVPLQKRLTWGYILTSRGCPYDCIFCSPAMRDTYGKKVRLRSARSVVTEMQSILDQRVNILTICDDNFTTVPSHVENICSEIIQQKMDLNWISHARVDTLTPELIQCMKQAGCVLLRIGVESASEKVIRRLRKSNNPETWVSRAEEVFDQARSIGLPTNALFIIGSPDETLEDIEESIKLACRLNTDMLLVNFFTPYPGSSFYKTSKYRITPDEKRRLYHYLFTLNFSCVPSSQLKEMLGKFYFRFYFRSSFIIRHLRGYLGFYLYNNYVLMKLIKMFFKVYLNESVAIHRLGR